MTPSITVVTLGPGDPQLMTLQTADALRHADRLMLRTVQHPVAAWLDAQSIAYKTLDALYDRYDDFDALHKAMARMLWKAACDAPVVYAVLDAANDGSVAELFAQRPDAAQLRVLPGVSRTDSCLAQLPGESAGGVRVVPAISCAVAGYHPGMPLLITELDNPALAGDVKLWLTELYDDEMQVTLFPSTVAGAAEPRRIALWELDRLKQYDHTVCLFVPAAPLMSRQRYCFDDLIEVMGILRGENGCPWDREQTHQSLRKYLIEEAWEVAAAIDEDDPEHLADELGDVLLQVVFHAHVGQSHGAFSLSDVTTAICRKMIYRHQHIFGDTHCETADEVSASWEQLKKAEKGLDTQTAVMQDVPKGLPALMRAAKVQKKAAHVGFDWDDAIGALPKIHEEADEVLAELQNSRDPGEELGDLLFSCVNVARLVRQDPEMLLQKATEKFIRRFGAMEKAIICNGKSLQGLTLAEMDVYWNMVKKAQQKEA